MDRYPDPDYNEFDYANGGIASFAYGGLTKTVPPASGPDPQGVETLLEDEVVTLYPPNKTSTTSISVNLK